MDITCSEVGSPYEVARAIERSAGMKDIDELVLEFGRFVRISADPQKRRRVITTHSLINGQRSTTGLVDVDRQGRLVDTPAVPATQ